MSEPATASGLRIVVDRELCFGFGDCVDTAPTVFALDEHNVATVLDPDGARLDIIVEAAQNCPVDAITITDADGVQLYP
jgi:ferredoxin